jgi:hypothetical protein
MQKSSKNLPFGIGSSGHVAFNLLDAYNFAPLLAEIGGKVEDEATASKLVADNS